MIHLFDLRSRLFAVCAALLISRSAGASLLITMGGVSGFIDDFNGPVLDAAWTEEDINNSAALIYATPLAGVLTVTDIQPVNAGTAGWVERKIVRDFNSISGDFTATMDLSWDHEDIEAMFAVTMTVLANDGEVLATVGLWDGWVGYHGVSAYVIGIGDLEVGSTRMPKATPATFSIERAGNEYAVKLNTLVLTNGTGSIKEVATVEVVFGFRIYSSSSGTSYFPEVALDRIAVVPGTITEPVPAGPWVMGEPMITYWAGPSPITDEVAQQMFEGGFNLAWVNTRGMEDVFLVDHYLSQLDILHSHGVRGILSLGNYIARDPADPVVLDDPQKKAELDSIIDGVKNHPALYAYHLIDEPSASIFTNIANLKAYILSKDPASLVHVNLYPSSAGSSLGVATYGEYLSQYMNIVEPQFLSYDRYNFGVSGDGLLEAFFANLNDIRSAAVTAAIPFRGIYQACSWTVNMRIPTGEEMRWLANTSLAYGAGGLSWYVYGWSGHDGGFIYPDGPALGGEPTSLYYYAKEVIHKEGLNLATELQPLNSLGVYHHGQIPACATALTSNDLFYIDPPLPQESVDATGKPIEGYVVGFFGTNQTPTHAMIVHMDYRTYSGIAQERSDEFLNPTRRFLVGPGNLEVFNARTEQWTSAGTNRVPIKLAPAAALLVRMQ